MLYFYVHTGSRNAVRQRYKAVLSMLVGLAVVLLLNIYTGYIGSMQRQLQDLPEAVPVTATVSNLNGSLDAGLAIPEKTVERIQNCPYVKDAVFTVQLYLGFGTFTTLNYEGKLNQFAAGTNAVQGIRGLKEEEITWMDGTVRDFFDSDRRECVVDKMALTDNGLQVGDTVTLTIFYYRYGDYHEIFFEPLTIQEYRITGCMDMEEYRGNVPVPSVLVPFRTVQKEFREAGLPFTADSASFTVKDPFLLDAFKQDMKDAGLLPVAATAEYRYDGNALTVRDSTFIQVSEHLQESLELMQAGLPLVLTVVAVIGYITAYLLIQSRRGEYAVMRSLGLGKWQCFGVMFLETAMIQLCACIVGSIIAFAGMGAQPEAAGRAAAIFLSCYLSGTVISIWHMGRLSVMAALSRQD